MVAAEDGGERKMKKKKKRSINRWLLCSKFRLKNREIKPAPIEETEKPTSSVDDGTDKQKPVPVIRRMTDRKNIPADDKAMNQETKEVTSFIESQKTFHLFCQKIYIKKKSFSGY